MKTLKKTILIALVLGIFAAGYFVAAWLAIIITAILVAWLAFSEVYNQIFR